MTFRKLRLLMSKYGFSILFMGFELWASFAAFFWLNRWFPHWLSVGVIGLLYVSTILAIVNRNTPPENKVTWLLIAVIPVFGSLLYLMFGERRLSKKEMIQLKNMESMKFREDNSHQLRKELKQESKAVYGLVKSILSMDHNADLYNGTASTFYPQGEAMYEQLLEDLRAAKKFIFIEFYIIDEGLMWNSILEILEQKVKEGVEVKLLYDDIGCMATLAGNYTKRLRKMGIDAHKFNKVIPRLTVAYIRPSVPLFPPIIITETTERFWSLMGRSAIRVVSIWQTSTSTTLSGLVTGRTVRFAWMDELLRP